MPHQLFRSWATMPDGSLISEPCDAETPEEAAKLARQKRPTAVSIKVVPSAAVFDRIPANVVLDK